MTDFIDAMDKLAAEIATASCDMPEGTGVVRVPLGDKIDAFKALMPYYALLKKNAGKDVDDDDLPNFDNFAKQIHTTEHTNGRA
jgi:hypothetical protein